VDWTHAWTNGCGGSWMAPRAHKTPLVARARPHFSPLISPTPRRESPFAGHYLTRQPGWIEHRCLLSSFPITDEKKNLRGGKTMLVCPSLTRANTDRYVYWGAKRTKILACLLHHAKNAPAGHRLNKCDSFWPSVNRIRISSADRVYLLNSRNTLS
jgi:hypothetical protein